MRFATNMILPLLMVLLNYSGISQVEISNFSKNNGLTSNTILVTKVDSKGVVWIGTANGISAYTNKGWVQIKSISDNNRYNKFIGRVSIIYEATNGDIWVCGEKGIFTFNGEYWTYFDDNENEGFEIADIFEDRRGWIWVAYEKYQSLKDVSVLGFSMVEGILQMYNGERWHKFTGEIGGSAAIAIGDRKQYFTSHIQDHKGNLWVTSLDGLYRFDGSSWTEYDQDDIPSDICNEVIQSYNNEIWVATRNGVAVRDNDEWIEFKKQKGIKGLDAVNFYEDYLNRLWVLSRKDDRFKSLCMYDGSKWKAYFKDKLKVKGDIDEMITYDSLILVYSDKGVSVNRNGDWTNLIIKNKIQDDHFSNFTRTGHNKILFTGRKGIYEYDGNNLTTIMNYHDGWKANSVFTVDGIIVVGTDKSGVFVINNSDIINYNTENGLADNNVKYVFKDKFLNIWAVTRSGVSVLEP